jgi:hypothetical protein
VTRPEQRVLRRQERPGACRKVCPAAAEVSGALSFEHPRTLKASTGVLHDQTTKAPGRSPWRGTEPMMGFAKMLASDGVKAKFSERPAAGLDTVSSRLMTGLSVVLILNSLGAQHRGAGGLRRRVPLRRTRP